MNKKKFIAEYTTEALEQYSKLDIDNQDKILGAIRSFELLGTDYKNINKLDYDLYEIKPTGVRAYFKYDENRRKIIIIGFICLKKTQKAPKRYMKQAIRNIENYQKEIKDEQK